MGVRQLALVRPDSPGHLDLCPHRVLMWKPLASWHYSTWDLPERLELLVWPFLWSRVEPSAPCGFLSCSVGQIRLQKPELLGIVLRCDQA